MVRNELERKPKQSLKARKRQVQGGLRGDERPDVAAGRYLYPPGLETDETSDEEARSLPTSLRGDRILRRTSAKITV